jgi:PhnO protein
MIDNIIIGAAAEEDLEGIANLVKELYEEIERITGGDLNYINDNIRELFEEPTSCFIVARALGSAIGFVNFSVRETILHPGKSGLIDELIVSKNYRGKGIGQQLISQVKNNCRELGCSELEVSTLMSNQNARKFYQGCGFTEKAVLLEIDL